MVDRNEKREPLTPREQAVLNFIKEPLTYFAAERTLLMWIRTGGGLIGLGFIVDRFAVFLKTMGSAGQSPEANSAARIPLWLGAGLALLGACVNVVSAVRYWRFQRRFDRGDTSPGRGVIVALILAFVLAVAGIGVAVYLLTSPLGRNSIVS